MKTSKKMLSLLLIAAMLVSVLCMGVSASDYAEVSISEGEPVTISWSGTTGTVVSVDGSSYIPRQFILWVRNGFTVSVDGTALTPNSAPVQMIPTLPIRSIPTQRTLSPSSQATAQQPTPSPAHITPQRQAARIRLL